MILSDINLIFTRYKCQHFTTRNCHSFQLLSLEMTWPGAEDDNRYSQVRSRETYGSIYVQPLWIRQSCRQLGAIMLMSCFVLPDFYFSDLLTCCLFSSENLESSFPKGILGHVFIVVGNKHKVQNFHCSSGYKILFVKLPLRLSKLVVHLLR